MINKRVWTVVNVSLGLIAVLLILNLFEIELPTLGKGIEQLEEESLCVMKNWENEFMGREIDSCCLEKRKLTLGCNQKDLFYKDQTLDWVCFTGNQIEYYLNAQAYNYCKKSWLR